jgi:uncharacterized membrane protein YdbT with pleckstrin-like domain
MTTTQSRSLHGVRRPTPALLTYYILSSIMAGPGLVVLIPLRIFRYRTLHYEFDAEGVTARWGILFRREISLTYARIQDIHLVSNVVERWLGLGRVEIQTASGKAGAEMIIEGLQDFEQVRDELYMRMRGARGRAAPAHITADPATEPDPPGTATGADIARVTAALMQVANELKEVRAILAHRDS